MPAWRCAAAYHLINLLMFGALSYAVPFTTQMSMRTSALTSCLVFDGPLGMLSLFMRCRSATTNHSLRAEQEAATAARRRASGLAADALFAAEEGEEEAQPSPADADAGDEDEAERQYRLELGRELQVRPRSMLGSECSLHDSLRLALLLAQHG